MHPRIANIYRYPVKGLSPEELDGVTLTVGECLPQDRRFALARAGTKFDPESPRWLPKTNFIMLMRDEKLAELKTRFDEQTGGLTIIRDGRLALQARITDAEGRRLADQFFERFLDGTLSGPPHLVEAAGHAFSDAEKKPNSATYKYVSLINMASIRALEQVVGVTIDPVRFRANVYFDGAPAWSEFDWVGSEFAVGGAVLKAVSETTRCAATTVNPATAKRDLNIPRILQKSFGHPCMGVYAEVVAGGAIRVGDPVVRREGVQSVTPGEAAGHAIHKIGPGSD